MLQQRGSKLGMSTWAGLLFGSPFVAVGIAIVLVGTKKLPVDPSSVHAPYWVLTVAGASFLLGGLMVWSMALKQFKADRRRRVATRQFPNEPALADYPWHPDGFAVSPWPAAAKTTAFAIGITVFLSMFNWWAFAARGPWMVKAIVILFDGAALALWWLAARKVGSALKFGPSRIRFARFPYRLAEPVLVRWQPPTAVTQMNKGTFTLRCVEEWMERGGGRDNAARLVQEEIWSAKWVLERPRNLQVKEMVELECELPVDAPATELSAAKPMFWELVVELDLPGLDFQESYLVPIYKVAALRKATVPPRPA